MKNRIYTPNPALKKSAVVEQLVAASADEVAARKFLEQWRWGDR